jgi:hypothetical protein
MNTTEKVAEISRIMADGYHFLTMRMVLESLETDPDQDATDQILDVVNKFYNLCKYVERRGEVKWK